MSRECSRGSEGRDWEARWKKASDREERKDDPISQFSIFSVSLFMSERSSHPMFNFPNPN